LTSRAGEIWDGSSPPVTLVRSVTLCVEKAGVIFQFSGTRVLGWRFAMRAGRPTLAVTVLAREVGLNETPNTSSATWELPSGRYLLWNAGVKVWLRRRDTYVVTSSTNTLRVEDSGGTADVTVSADTYSGGALAAALKEALNDNTTLAGTYSVVYDRHSRRFMVWCDEQFKVHGANAASTMKHLVGFLKNTTFGSVQLSCCDAKPEAFEAFTDSDQVKVSDFEVSADHGLRVSTDATQAGQVTEPWQAQQRKSTVTLQIPRFVSEELAREAEFGTLYELKVELPAYYEGTMPSQPHKLQFYFPALVVTQTDVPLDGPGVLQERVSFVAGESTFLDLLNFAPGEYFCRALPDAGLTQVTAVGSYRGKLAIGGVTSEPKNRVLLENGTSWETVSADLGTGVQCLQEFGGKLYVGGGNGKIFSWDGATLTEEHDIGSEAVADLALYAEKLYALGADTGKVFESEDGSTWTAVWSPGKTKAWRLISYGGYLWATVQTSSIAQVYRYDGSTWTVMLNHTTTVSYASLVVHRGMLYVSLDDHLKEWHEWESAWYTYDSFGFSDAKHLVSWAGNLLVLRAAMGSDMYVYDLRDEAETKVYDLDLTVTGKPLVLAGRLVLAVAASSPRYYASPADMFLVLQNSTSTNPLI